MLSVKKTDHACSFIYSLLGSRVWGLLDLCRRSYQISTKQEEGCCLYLTCSSFKAFKMCLTNRKSTYYITCLILFLSSKKAEINPVVNAERTFFLLGDILLAPCCFKCFQKKKKQIKNQNLNLYFLFYIN